MRRALRQTAETVLAIPGVLRQVSPGYYFQRCLPLWKSDLSGLEKAKAEALTGLASPRSSDRLILGEPALHQALLARQAATFTQLAAQAEGLELLLRNAAPVVTGIGQPHPLETGFAFLKPHGIPYLAASGIKGAVRAACEAVWAESAPDRKDERLRHYFGEVPPKKSRVERRDREGSRGALVFLDAFPGVKDWRTAFRADIVNPHYVPYYQGTAVPADWHSPVPSYFLTLKTGIEWTLRILYAPADPSTRRPAWREEIRGGVDQALTVQGLGAKKSWGYGLFDVLAVVPLWTSPPAPAGEDRGGEGVQPPAPPPARVSPETSALRMRIEGLKVREVKPQMADLAAAIGRCPGSERPALVGALRERLGQLGFKARDWDGFVTRHEELRSAPEA